ncbi:DUF58 domain-containing protein, partial [Bordetella pertussis]|uniref:DUF58 domain-containing protein n=1 Tax=Bordetella pertussis TaxID=520 RepID=UPI0012B173A2
RGRGLDFAELRRYVPGDDLRQLDPRASLRYGKPYVRAYTEERDRPAMIGGLVFDDDGVRAFKPLRSRDRVQALLAEV